MDEHEKNVQDWLLLDIAFEIDQLTDFNIMLRNNPFDKKFKEITNNIRRNKERLIDEYTERYGHEPDLQDAKRLFLENKAKAIEQRGETRAFDYDDPKLGSEDLGDQETGADGGSSEDLNGEERLHEPDSLGSWCE